MLKAFGSTSASVPNILSRALENYLLDREQTNAQPPSLRIRCLEGRRWAMRVLRGRLADGQQIELIDGYVESAREADLFRELNDRFGVTRREFDILRCLREGMTNADAADALKISVAFWRHAKRVRHTPLFARGDDKRRRCGRAQDLRGTRCQARRSIA
jgi:hypothetical protein